MKPGLDAKNESQNENYEEFFEKVFSLENDPNRHNYTQTEIDEIFEKVLRIVEEKNLYDDFSLVCQLEHSFQLFGDFKYNQNTESITDKAYRALLKFANKYPNAAHQFENLFGQNHTVQPRVLLDAISEIYWNPDYDSNFKGSLVYSLQYILSFGGENYIEDIVKKLDFNDRENYIKIASFLELIKQVSNLGADQDYSEGRILDVISSALESKLDEKKEVIY